MEPFQILIVIAIFCIVIEVFTPLFVFASFAVGFLFASYGSYMDYSSTNQIYGFVIGPFSTVPAGEVLPLIAGFMIFYIILVIGIPYLYSDKYE